MEFEKQLTKRVVKFFRGRFLPMFVLFWGLVGLVEVEVVPKKIAELYTILSFSCRVLEGWH